MSPGTIYTRLGIAPTLVSVALSRLTPSGPAQSCLLLCVLLCANGCKPSATTQNAAVQIHRRKTFSSELLLEGSERTDLRIGSTTIRNVRGYSPYHLAIPQRAMIYCVSDGPGHRSIVHFVRLSDSKDIVIDVSTTELGYDIGATGGRKEIVERTEGQTITIARCYGDMKSVFVFDLTRGECIKAEVMQSNEAVHQ